MIRENLLLLWVLLVPLVLGGLLLRACGLRIRDDRLGFFSWSWPTGCLVLGVSLLTYIVFGIEPWLWWTAPVFALIATGLLASRRVREALPGELRVPRPRLHAGFVLFTFLLACFCLLHITAGAARPIVEGDEGNIWSLKAKSLVLDYYLGDFALAQHWNLHPDYPLLNPLLQAWVHSQFGQIEHFAARFLVQGCVLSMLLATAAALRARLSALRAGCLLLLLPFAPAFEQALLTASADGMLALGLVMIVDGFLRWRAEGRSAWLWLAAIGAAFAAWSKNEAALYLLAAAAAVVLQFVVCRSPSRGKWLHVAGCALLPAAVIALQVCWNRHFDLKSDLFGANPTGKSMPELLLSQFAERAPQLAMRALDTMLFSDAPHAIFLVLLAAPLLWPRMVFRRDIFAVWFGLLLSLLCLHLIWIGSFLPLQFHLDTSYLRVLFQMVPAALVWFAALAQVVLSGSDPAALKTDATA
ncbi:MAG: hypothetical protein NT107_02680 [Planctomycetota bacterium]|nr:hypothetical protein [Planctomycetota bacterium]